ncbi:hypothetical protein, partial [Accumulibacter sp.]|uniref:hypothetical protein n=1 Tax=Accumulibacter sp. TaxID=2053492 RepID=UPI002C3C6970
LRRSHQLSGVTQTTLVPSDSSNAGLPFATTTPLPTAVLNVVVKASLLLQNTTACHAGSKP